MADCHKHDKIIASRYHSLPKIDQRNFKDVVSFSLGLSLNTLVELKNWEQCLPCIYELAHSTLYKRKNKHQGPPAVQSHSHFN